MKFEQKANSKFHYAFTMDEERGLEHLFWSPSQYFDWYESYEMLYYLTPLQGECI